MDCHGGDGCAIGESLGSGVAYRAGKSDNKIACSIRRLNLIVVSRDYDDRDVMSKPLAF